MTLAPEEGTVETITPISAIEAGDSLADYQIVKQLGVGRDGVAYLAVTPSGESCELRVLSESSEEYVKQRALRLRRAALLKHEFAQPITQLAIDNVVKFVALTHEPLRTLAMLSGEELAALDPLELSFQLVDCLAKAGRFGLTHDSLSEETIFIRENGKAWLDFTGLQVADAETADDNDTIVVLASILDRMLKIATFPEHVSRRNVAGLKQLLRQTQHAEDEQRPELSEIHAGFLSLQLHVAPVSDAASSEHDHTCEQPVTPSLRDSTSELPAIVNDSTGEIAPNEQVHVFDSTFSRLKTGDTLGRYRLSAKLGEGGMGEVFRAEDITSGDSVAIKILNETAAQRPNALRRFQKEARLLASIDNPYVTRLIEVNEQDNRHYMVMELVVGEDLNDRLQRDGKFAETEALQIIGDVAKALADAHERGIIHRDIKPENILLTNDIVDGDHCGVKLTDFGIARQIQQSATLAMTQDGSMIGTPRYMSPEQCKACSDLSPQSDVYSLGITLFELLAGSTPFSSNDAMKLAAMHCFDAPPLVRQLNDELSPAVEELVGKMLAKKPEDRFADARHVVREIDRLLRGEPVQLAMHPAVPTYEAGKLFTAEYSWTLASTPEQLWPYVSDTDRLNRAAGLPPAEFRTEVNEQGESKRVGVMRLGGMTITWQEHPFEWIENQRLSILREFDKGPFVWLASEVKLTRTATGGTELQHDIRICPRNSVGGVLAKVEGGFKARRSFTRTYTRVDEVIQAIADASDLTDPFEKTHILNRSKRKRLDARVDELMSRGVDVDLATRLAEFLSTAPTSEVARIRSAEFADRFSFDRQKTLSAMLQSADVGLLTIAWDILCPTCRVAAEATPSLQEIQTHTHCEACNIDFESDLAGAVELVFQVHADLRSTELKTYCSGGPARLPHVVAQITLATNERLELELALSAGRYQICGPALQRNIGLQVRNQPAASYAEICVGDKNTLHDSITLPAGKQVLLIENTGDSPQLLRVERSLGRDGAVSAAAATSMPEFRQLFPQDLLQDGQLLRAEQITLLVAEIDSIDELYGEHDDAAAYEIVKHVLDAIEEEITLHRGLVVKELGEGLSAAFTDPLDAVNAALRLSAAIRERPATADMTLSVGVHRGPALVATRNDRLDYFGATAKIAATLPRKATEGIVLTEAVFSDPLVAELITGRSQAAQLEQVDLPGKLRQIIQTVL